MGRRIATICLTVVRGSPGCHDGGLSIFRAFCNDLARASYNEELEIRCRVIPEQRLGAWNKCNAGDTRRGTLPAGVDQGVDRSTWGYRRRKEDKGG